MNGGNITTTGNQTYGEIVKLGVDTTLTAGAGNVNIQQHHRYINRCSRTK